MKYAMYEIKAVSKIIKKYYDNKMRMCLKMSPPRSSPWRGCCMSRLSASKADHIADKRRE